MQCENCGKDIPHKNDVYEFVKKNDIIYCVPCNEVLDLFLDDNKPLYEKKKQKLKFKKN